MYLNGTGVTKNCSIAITYLIPVANHNIPDAQTLLGQLYVSGNQFPGCENMQQDIQNGLHLLTDAANQGFAKAIDSLIWFYTKAIG